MTIYVVYGPHRGSVVHTEREYATRRAAKRAALRIAGYMWKKGTLDLIPLPDPEADRRYAALRQADLDREVEPQYRAPATVHKPYLNSEFI